MRQRIEKNWTFYEKYQGIEISKAAQYSGILLYQELTCRITPKTTLSGRITFFDTDSYDSRLYQFERDVPGIFTNQMVYGSGNKWYIYAGYKISRIFQFYLKFSSILYYNRQTIGTSNDEIEGNQLSIINLQLETKL